MGRFASHLKLVSEQNQDHCSLTQLEYAFVDYTRLTDLANNDTALPSYGNAGNGNGTSSSFFRLAWREELERTSKNFDEHYERSTRMLIDACFDNENENSNGGEEQEGEGEEVEEYGPNHPAVATPDPRELVSILLRRKGRNYVLDILKEYGTQLQVASLNSEALHLALKKRDKRALAAAKSQGKMGEFDPRKQGAMRELLPKLYASTSYHATGARSLAGELDAIRELLAEEERAKREAAKAKEEGKEDEANIASPTLPLSNSATNLALANSAEASKEDEYRWFLENVKEKLTEEEGGKIGGGGEMLASLVAHRGFHSERDDSVARPIENSLSSFEYAWSAGVHLAECDVGATKDEKIIMAHDEDFRRLALLSNVKESNTVVKDLTLSDIMRMPLKHGARPPLLVDVLRSAMAIGEHAKLVIEIKPGNSEIVEPLMMLFNRHPALLSRVAVIMSFDAYVIQEVADRFALKNLHSNVGGGLGVIGEGKQSAEDLPGLLLGGGGGGGSGLMRRRSGRRTRARARPIQSVSYGANLDGGGQGCEGGCIPKLLVLTAHMDYRKEDIITSVKAGFEGLGDKLPVSNGIDGVYLEFEEEMLTPEGREHMLRLAETYTVGVWMLKPRDPDALSVAKKLVDECGVSYVNTDFHRKFFST